MTSTELKQIVADSGLTQLEFATKLGVRRATVNEWLNDKKPIGKMSAQLIEMKFKK